MSTSAPVEVIHLPRLREIASRTLQVVKILALSLVVFELTSGAVMYALGWSGGEVAVYAGWISSVMTAMLCAWLKGKAE